MKFIVKVTVYKSGEIEWLNLSNLEIMFTLLYHVKRVACFSISVGITYRYRKLDGKRTSKCVSEYPKAYAVMVGVSCYCRSCRSI